MRSRSDRVLDAGEKGCGLLILSIAEEMQHLAVGQVLEVHAYDPLADLDIRCWCHLTGHRLLHANLSLRPQRFYICKEDEDNGETADSGDDCR